MKFEYIYLKAAISPPSTITNLPQFYGGHFAQLGNFFASAAAPQVRICNNFVFKRRSVDCSNSQSKTKT